MIEAIKNWVIGLTATAVICSCLLAITPECKVKKVVSFACGIAVIISLLSIKTGFDFSTWSKKISSYETEASSFADKTDEANKKLTQSIIEEKCRAYILDKGEKLGLTNLQVNVKTKWSEDDSCWYPESAEIKCSGGDSEKKELKYYIEASLGIAKEKQTWSN